MRVSSVIRPLSMGTLKSTRTSARLPPHSTSRMVCLAIIRLLSLLLRARHPPIVSQAIAPNDEEPSTDCDAAPTKPLHTRTYVLYCGHQGPPATAQPGVCTHKNERGRTCYAHMNRARSTPHRRSPCFSGWMSYRLAACTS